MILLRTAAWLLPAAAMLGAGCAFALALPRRRPAAISR
jgi:hypothetical protein